jgi:hypothetical protein
MSSPSDHKSYTSFTQLLNTLNSYYDDQHLSSFPLFTQLPPELRLQVYTHYFLLECTSRGWRGPRWWLKPYFTLSTARDFYHLKARRDRVLRLQAQPEEHTATGVYRNLAHTIPDRNENKSGNFYWKPGNEERWNQITPFFPALCLVGGQLGSEATQHLLQTSHMELGDPISAALLYHLFDNFTTYAPTPAPAPVLNTQVSPPGGGHLFTHLRRLRLSPQISFMAHHFHVANRILEPLKVKANADDMVLSGYVDVDVGTGPVESLRQELQLKELVHLAFDDIKHFVDKCPQLIRLYVKPLLRVTSYDNIGSETLMLAQNIIGTELGTEMVEMFDGTSRFLKIVVEFAWGVPRSTKWHKEITREDLG